MSLCLFGGRSGGKTGKSSAMPRVGLNMKNTHINNKTIEIKCMTTIQINTKYVEDYYILCKKEVFSDTLPQVGA